VNIKWGEMMKVVLLLSGLVLGLSSCSYLAGESASNYIASGGKTVSYVENRTVSSIIAGHGAALGVGLILAPVLNAWAEKKMEEGYRQDLRKLMFDCLYSKNNPTDEDIAYCREEAISRKTDVDGYFYALRFGKCQNEFFGLFKGFRKCWYEAFEYLENYSDKKGSLKNKILQTYYDAEYLACLPPVEKYTGKEQELQRKYFMCKEKAKRKAEESLKEIEPKLREYLAQSD